jgi:WD40 repeat protein
MVRQGHGEPVSSLALSPDGKRLITAHYDMHGNGTRLRVWDVDSGRPVREFLEGVLARSVAFSADGKQIVTSSDSVDVWDAATGKRLHAGPRELSGGSQFHSNRASFSKDGKYVVTVKNDGARVWEIATGKVVGPYGGQVSAAMLSGDGKHLIWADARDVMIVDWSTDKVIQKFEGQIGSVTCLDVSADDKWLVTGSRDNTVRLWELTTGKKVRAFVGHRENFDEFGRLINGNGIISVALSADAKWLVTTGSDDTVIIFDREGGNEVRRIDRFKNPLFASTLSADGKWLVTAERIEKWDQLNRGDGSGKNQAKPVVRFQSQLNSSNTIRLWEVASGKMVRVFQRPKNGPNILTLSSDGKFLATAGPDESARLWDLTAGKQSAIFGDHDLGIFQLAIGGDNKWLATLEMAPNNNRVMPTTRVWDIRSGKVERQFVNVRGLAISAHGNCLALDIGFDGQIDCLDLKTSKVTSINGGNFGPIVSPDGRVLVTVNAGNDENGNNTRQTKFWNAQTGEELGTIKGEGMPAAFSNDAKWLVDGYGGMIWDVDKKTVVHSFGSVSCLSLSGDKKRVAGEQGNNVAVWDVATRKRLSLFTGHGPRSLYSRGITAVALTHDGKRLFSASSDDDAIRLSDADTGKELCKLYTFFDGTWAVVDERGHYDAANNGDVNFLMWAVGDEIHPVTRFRDGRHEPGLLKKYLGPILNSSAWFCVT